jgi:tetratricopeptide (TPR) repeat protein
MQKELAGQPEAQAEILTVMGVLYRRFGAYDKARLLLEQALASGETVFGTEHVRVAQALNDLGALLTEMGDYATAERYLERALNMRRRLLGPHADLAVTVVELGRVYQDQGFNDRAEPLQREGLAIRLQVLGPEHGQTAVSLSDLGSVLRLKGDLAAAEPMLEQALALNRKARGETHANTAVTLHDLGLIAATRGDNAKAESLFLRGIDMYRRAMGQRHPIVAIMLNSHSRVMINQRRYDEAAAALQEALELARPALGARHPLIGIYTLNLASVRLALGDPAAAEALARDGLAIREHAPVIVPARRRTFLEDDWTVEAAKNLLAAAERAQRTRLHRPPASRGEAQPR